MIFGIFDIGLDTLASSLPYCLLALGIFLSYRILDFADLGAEGSFTLGGAITALLTYNLINPFLALLISLFAGMLAGAITGLLSTKLKITPLLSGIITMTSLFTINMIIMGKAMYGDSFDFFKSSSNQINDISLAHKFYYGLYDLMHNTLNMSWFKPKYALIILTLLIIGIVGLVVYYFYGTEIGMSLRATGMNKSVARAQGINTDFMTILGLSISNGIIALSGALVSQVQFSASTSMGVGVLVIGLASIIIGEAIFGKKTFKNNMISVMLGALIYYLIITIVINLGILDSHFLKLLSAITIVLVLVISNIKKKRGDNNVKNRKLNQSV